MGGDDDVMKRSGKMSSQLVAVFLALLFSTAAYARDEADPRKLDARRHFESGMAHFNLQEYAFAISEFEDAYRLQPDPAFLYNLGQAHRLAGHDERALYFYRTYLRAAPEADNRAEVESRISDLEPRVAASPSTGGSVAGRPGEHDRKLALSVAPAPSERARPVYKKWWFWTTLAGVAVVGAAVATTVALVPKDAAIPGGTDGNVEVMFH
jgi:tetratricopeptide (TPR) repeat protein